MSLLVQVLLGILILAILIFVHELGHFLVAKACGVSVLEFAIGFGKKIAKYKRGITRYSIGLIPLGGYVRMLGDDPRYLDEEFEGKSLQEIEESMRDSERAFITLEDIEERSPEELAQLNDRQAWFLKKNYWQKIAIVFAGPLFNILFAWFVAIFLLLQYGAQDVLDESVIGAVREDAPAAIAGMQEGDKILSINGATVTSWYGMAQVIRKSAGEQLKFEIMRNDEPPQFLDVTPRKIDPELAAVYGESPDDYVIGVGPTLVNVPVPVVDAVLLGGSHVVNFSVLTVKSMWAMASGLISTKHIGGPISIVKVAAKSAESGLESVLNFMILLSVSLAILNLLPIPVLDGGHILIFTMQALTGERLSKNFYERMSQVGMILLLALMMFAIGNDIVNLIS